MSVFSNNNRFLISCMAFLVYATNFFQYKNWDYTLGGWSSYFVALIILYVFFITHRRITYKSVFSHVIVLLMLVPLLQTFSKVFIYHESVYDERGLYTQLITFFFFYIFQAKQIEEKDLVKAITIVGFIVFFIQIWQVLNPHSAVFGVYRPDDLDHGREMAEERNHLYRYRLGTDFITLFCFYYSWGALQNKYSLKRLCMFAIFAISLYLYLTRQLMFVSLLAIFCTFIFNKNLKIKLWKVILVILVVGLLFYQFASAVFGDLIERTLKELDDTNIRVLAAAYYWEGITESPIVFLIGHGPINELLYLQEYYEFYTSDVGLIGEWFLYGLLWLILYGYILFLVLKKYADQLPLYIKLFVFGTSLNSIMIFPYRYSYEFFIWTVVLYIVSLYVDEDPIYEPISDETLIDQPSQSIPEIENEILSNDTSI